MSDLTAHTGRTGSAKSIVLGHSETERRYKMAHRSGAGQGDQKRFTQTAKRVKNINVRPKVSRGGIRL